MSVWRPNSYDMRFPFWLSSAIAVFVAPLFYFILRSAYHFPLTSYENFFVWTYAAFCSFNWTYAYIYSSRLDVLLPRWLTLFWVRVVLYFVVAGASIWVLNKLRLPAFYDAVIGKSIIFLILPYVFRRSR